MEVRAPEIRADRAFVESKRPIASRALLEIAAAGGAGGRAAHDGNGTTENGGHRDDGTKIVADNTTKAEPALRATRVQSNKYALINRRR